MPNDSQQSGGKPTTPAVQPHQHALQFAHDADLIAQTMGDDDPATPKIRAMAAFLRNNATLIRLGEIEMEKRDILNRLPDPGAWGDIY
jgi:hypothetical protein